MLMHFPYKGQCLYSDAMAAACRNSACHRIACGTCVSRQNDQGESLAKRIQFDFQITPFLESAGSHLWSYTMTRNLLVVLILMAIGAPAFAHHSEAAEYDSTKPVKVTGIIKKVEWQNPHVWFYVDVKDENGKITTWGFSGAPPGALMLQRHHEGCFENRSRCKRRRFSCTGRIE